MQIGSSAQAGLFQALRRFDASAQRVARAGESSSEVDLAVEAVEQITATHAVSANIATLQTANELTKRLLDMKV